MRLTIHMREVQPQEEDPPAPNSRASEATLMDTELSVTNSPLGSPSLSEANVLSVSE